jgi:DNA repair exonuclease SbcCD ATPase subunit
VAVFVGVQQYSASARQARKDKEEQRAERIRQQDEFLRDWNGDPERPGHASSPGVMERLQKIESELKHNGGSSIKDAVKRIEKKLTEINERLDDGNSKFEDIEDRINNVRN